LELIAASFSKLCAALQKLRARQNFLRAGKTGSVRPSNRFVRNKISLVRRWTSSVRDKIASSRQNFILTSLWLLQAELDFVRASKISFVHDFYRSVRAKKRFVQNKIWFVRRWKSSVRAKTAACKQNFIPASLWLLRVE
jgi:hypothetical protein